jgi:hypothetical protein
MRYEVRSEPTEKTIVDPVTNELRHWIVETRRTDRKEAELDADLLTMLGKKVWIVEIDR